jgi:hypothetical protein
MMKTTERIVVLVVLVIALAYPWWKPALLREVLFKRNMRLNIYLDRNDIPPKCPTFESISHPSVKKLSYAQYSGVWYGFASNEPTQVKGTCSCDRFQWEPISASASFQERLDVICTLWPGASPMHLPVQLEGKTNATGTLAMMLEGAPSAGAHLIPNYVIWIDPNYEACIRYSCKEDYLGVPVFHSLQIWTRSPTEKNSKKGKALMKQAHELLDFNDEYIEFAPHGDCDLLPSL